MRRVGEAAGLLAASHRVELGDIAKGWQSGFGGGFRAVHGFRYYGDAVAVVPETARQELATLSHNGHE
jgi:hypothetical protein